MELNIKQNVMVTPAQSTWKGNQSLSEWDQIGCTTYTSSIYFYAPTTLPFQTITQTIIDSLSHTLPHFYPLAGRLRSLNNGRFQLECNGNGVVFVAAELNADLSYFEKDYFTPTLESDRLLPYVNESLPIHELPLLLVQLTKFSCGGLSLGVTASHVLIDGLSAANFMTEWARIARGLPLQKAPFFDKKAFGVGDCCGSNPQRFDHSNDFGNMPFLLKQPNAEELKKMKTTMFTLKLTKEQVQKLKNKANNDLNRPSRPYTRYEVLAAHIWRCSSKARKHDTQQPTACAVTIDSRKRLEPPLPFEYFGNGVFDVTARCTAGELLSSSLSEVASKVRSVIEMVTNDYVLSAIEYLKSQQDLTKFQYSYKSSTNGGGKYCGNPVISVINYVNLPFKGIDFGWGKEIHFGPAYHEIDGDLWIIRNSCDDDESLLIVICLLVEHVEAFKMYFFDDMI
uniref:Uncharacterized protein n=1 Tax=Cannabis sativa TaxID=3483 RepID=A0A803PSN0_CANSA